MEKTDEKKDSGVQKKAGNVEVSLTRFHKFSTKTMLPYDIIDSEIEMYLTTERLNVIVLDDKDYLYIGGYYRFDEGGKIIKAYIRELIYPELATASRIDRVYKLMIMDYRLMKTDKEVNAYPKHWINFQNGMLDVKTLEMHAHDPKYLSINQIPYEYIWNAKYEGSWTDKFIKGLVPDEQDRKMLLEYSAYCWTLDTHFQKFLTFVGLPGSGKSTVINLIVRVTGEENTCGITLQNLNERFYPTRLHNKLLNACGDLPKTALKQTDTIKKLTGEDIIVGEYKGVDSFDFYSYAKLLFSANEMPVNLDEKSDAFYRRLLIIEIKKKGEYIPDLDKKLSDPYEIQGFICACVETLSRLYASGGEMDSPNSKKFVHEYHRESDSVMSFMEDQTEVKPGGRIERKLLYDAYVNYCIKNGWTDVSNKTFFSNLRGKGYSEVKVNGIMYFKNVCVKIAPLICPQIAP
ncbi:MAG: phage/plasmid primase, P4 family [Lachnospiraceae bacterium]|nr:phage/plasmid primase, P4 family [Lachnospiraceae bacterium]